VIVSDNDLPRKYIVNKTRKDEQFGIIIDCHYFIKKLHFNNNKNIHEGDEVIKVKFIVSINSKSSFDYQFRSMKSPSIV
jgi:hypothetical protein